MTSKTPEVEEVDPIEEFRTRAQDAEARNAELEEAIATLNDLVGDYQQKHADSVLEAATFKSKYKRALERLSAAGTAQ